MKKNYIIVLIIVTLLGGGCDSFLDTEPKQQIPSKDAYENPTAAEVALNGIYNRLGSYQFCGNYATSIGDFCADISLADGSAGHFVELNNYSFDETRFELRDIWYYGYKVISESTSLLASIDNLLKEYPNDEKMLEGIRAQAYALRAYTYFKLVNIYGLPYGIDSNPTGGLVLMDAEPIPFETKVSRSSVKQTYDLILKDIKSAKEAYSRTNVSLNQYYMNKAAVYALSSRVNLFMKNYVVAASEAQEALNLRDANPLDNDKYDDIWKTTAISAEDIFTIVKSNDDNLSANSINNLYNPQGYKAKLTDKVISEFSDKDVRKQLIDGKSPLKFEGIPSASLVSNIPQFRVSEMYLNIAEAKANSGDIGEARKALLFTAKRDEAITDVSKLPATKSGLLAFIAKERKREFFQEGHRLFDARRTGELIDANNGKYKNFDVQKFVFPIPSSEINSGFKCEQNEGWHNNLPQNK